MLRRVDARNDWVFTRCKEVEIDPNDHLDLWAREHYKSSVITFAKTIQDIVANPEITIGIFSHTRPTAKKFLQQIMREFEDNALLRWTFDDILWAEPRRQAAKWSEDEGIIVRRLTNPKEPTLSAWGLVDNMPTGAHFDGRIYDDAVAPASVTTPEQIHKTTEAWELSDNLGKQDGWVRYIGTRYSLFDTYKVMIERGVKVRKYAATHNGRIDGNPVFFSKEYWEKKKATQSRRILAAQHMQNPLADEDATFRIEWLRSYEVRPRTLNVLILVDPSKGMGAKSDRTAIPVLGLAASEKTFLIDGYCHRMSLSERWSAIRDLYRKWSRTPGVQNVYVGYERYGAQSDKEYFELQMEVEKIIEDGKPVKQFFDITELNWTREGTRGEQGKRDRVERLEPDFRNARFYLPLAVLKDGKPMTWHVDLNEESKTFQSIIYEDFKGLTKHQLQVIEAGSPDLTCKALKRIDEEGRAYDLTLQFIQEYLNFPFGEHDDLVDAASRKYDMDVRAPVIVAKGSTDPKIYQDS